MTNPFEKLPIPSPEKPKEEKPPIEVVSPIGERKKTPEEIAEAKEIREKIERKKALKEMEKEKWREIRGKQKRGELLSKEEAAVVRERELARKSKEEEELEKIPEKPAAEKEKTKEELEKELEEKRKIYAEAYKQSREVLAKGKKEKKFKELLEAYEPTIKPVREKYILAGDSEKLKQGDKEAEERRKNFIEKLTTSGIKKEKAEAIYEKELKEAEYNKAIIDYGKKLEKEGVSMNEICNRMYSKKDELLKNAQVEIWPPKEKNIFRKSMEKWFKMSTRKRIAYSTLILTGTLAGAGAIAGIGILAGASMATIAKFAGFNFARALAGATVGQAVAGAIEKTYGRKLGKTKAEEEKKLIAEFTIDNFSEIEKKQHQLLERWYKKERNKTLLKAMAATVIAGGISFGLGPMIGEALGIKIRPEAPAKPGTAPETIPKPPVVEEAPAKSVVPPVPEAQAPEEQAKPAAPPPEVSAPVTPSPEEQAKPAVPSPETQARPGIAPEPTPTVENIVEAKDHDSLWKIIDGRLEANYGQKFTSLNEAQKTYIIDALKDKIAENPKSFGLEDIDKIKTGQKIDLTLIFEDKAGIENSFKRAGDLSQAQIEQIKHNNEVLRNWLKEHPGQRLTSERVEEILGKGKIMPAPPETPAAEALTTKAPAPPETLTGLELARIMDLNEIANIKALGLTEGEYKAIQNLTVGEFLERVPDEAHLFGGQIPDPEIASPYHGILGAIELEKHLKLADFIRCFEPGEETKEMTVRQFLRTIGPKGTITI